MPNSKGFSSGLVSIVTPCLNAARFIREAAQSVAAQDYPQIQYIVMDGGSSDGTLEILAEFPNVMVHSAPDRGTPEAINRGFDCARGEYFTFLNADDVLLPGAISAAVCALQADPELAGVYGAASWIDESGGAIGPYPVRDFDPRLLERECFICQPASLLRSRFFEAAGRLNPEFGLTFDYEFCIRLTRIAALRRIQAPMALSRMHRGSKTLGQRAEVLAETLRMFRLHYSYAPFPWVWAYQCHRADGRDQFFEQPERSLLRYLKSLPAGLSLNPNARIRYAREWGRYLTWRRVVDYLRGSGSRAPGSGHLR